MKGGAPWHRISESLWFETGLRGSPCSVAERVPESTDRPISRTFRAVRQHSAGNLGSMCCETHAFFITAGEFGRSIIS